MTKPRSRGPFTAFLLPLTVAWGAAGGVPSPSPSVALAERATLGTIEAVLDGEERTWYVLAGEAKDGPWAAATWMEMSEGVMVTMGGVDAPDLDIGQISRSEGAAGMTMGGYEGSTLNLAVMLPPEPRPTTADLPEAEPAGTTVIYQPRFDLSDMSGMLRMTEGRIEVEAVSLSDGEVSLRGTFHGVVSTMDGSEGMEITDGRFQVEGIPSVDAIQPRG